VLVVWVVRKGLQESSSTGMRSRHPSCPRDAILVICSSLKARPVFSGQPPGWKADTKLPFEGEGDAYEPGYLVPLTTTGG
jgi:hypothetical protein